MNNNRLFVGNIPFTVTEKQIEDLFRQHGNVVHCKLVTDRDTWKSRGFAFVEMGTVAEAENARTKLNGHTLDRRAIVVNEARPQEER